MAQNKNSELNKEEIKCGITELHLRSALNRHDKLKEVLAEEQLNINVRDNAGNTPMHYAARYNNIKIIKILDMAGADVNAQNNLGQTPLHYAFQAYEGEAIKMLRQRGSSTKIKDNNGVVPAATLRLRVKGGGPIPLLAGVK
jgi:ankyrin repeat protein